MCKYEKASVLKSFHSLGSHNLSLAQFVMRGKILLFSAETFLEKVNITPRMPGLGQ